MTVAQKRLAVKELYRSILGRNRYSQNLRNYCFVQYKDGKYYSDCSSSISHSYQKAGYGFGILNTVGMYNSPKMTDVPVIIKKGIIQNPEVLRIGDVLLFAGSDSSRKAAGYVGHVEMVYAISNTSVTLAGHGSGTPSTKSMNTYCKSRYGQKSSTALGHKGLIRVRRFIQDDGNDLGGESRLGDRTLRNGMEGADVKELQSDLITLGYDCGKWGADGEFGDYMELAVETFQRAKNLVVDGIVGVKTVAALVKAMTDIKPVEIPKKVKIAGGNCYVRTEPSTSGSKLGVVYNGELLDYSGEIYENGWLRVIYKNQDAWVSGKYGQLVD